MRATKMLELAAVGVMAIASAGCGVEALFYNAAANENDRPVTKLTGKIGLDQPTFHAYGVDGTEIEIVSATVKNGEYALSLASAVYDNVRVNAVQGEVVLRTMLTHAIPESVTPNMDLDARSTTLTLIVLARASADGTTLSVVPPSGIRQAWKLKGEDLDVDGPAKDLLAMVTRLLDGADKTVSTSTTNVALPLFQDPAYDPEFLATTSAINPAWFEKRGQFDYTGDGNPERTSRLFDVKLGDVAKDTRSSVAGCPDPNNIRVVFSVNFAEGQKDGNCATISRFKWVRDQPGKSMFFVGGVHKDSPIQDPAIDAMLGNTAGWIPNQVPMYDDGTNGDAVAGDNIWTVTFAMPRGLRMGYKYTWGHRGDLWTGSEEWPGNQRLLEVNDVNGDGFVYRVDNFGDEATNKDLANGNIKGSGTVRWDTDANEDGVPDAQERKVDTNNDCTLDEWETPRGVGLLTVDCDTLGN